jgi:hypothetical protein
MDVAVGGRTLAITVDINVLECVRASLAQWKRKTRKENTSEAAPTKRRKTVDTESGPAAGSEKKSKKAAPSAAQQ